MNHRTVKRQSYKFYTLKIACESCLLAAYIFNGIQIVLLAGTGIVISVPNLCIEIKHLITSRPYRGHTVVIATLTIPLVSAPE